MHPLLSADDEAAVTAAIRALEARTSAELRVCVSRQAPVADAQVFAEEVFARLGMAATRERNAALIVVLPHARKLAVMGDEGLAAVTSGPFWQNVVEAMVAQLRHGHLREALVEGIGQMAQLLAQHWPRLPGDINELPDELVLE